MEPRLTKIIIAIIIALFNLTSEITYCQVQMVYVEGGDFQMGSSFESPIHKVTLTSFLIGKTEVTQAEYKTIMDNNPSEFDGANYPVESVKWIEMIKYCNLLSIAEGFEPCYKNFPFGVICDFESNGYRLPTEAEWEYAARGGNKSKGYEYSGSDNIDDVAWYNKNSDNRPHDVGLQQPNELGLYDMSGNIWEWCWDGFATYLPFSVTNPTGIPSADYRVGRGGSWAAKERHCLVWYRSGRDPFDERHNNVGFRLAQTAKN